jgi:hypothetical protein
MKATTRVQRRACGGRVVVRRVTFTDKGSQLNGCIIEGTVARTPGARTRHALVTLVRSQMRRDAQWRAWRVTRHLGYLRGGRQLVDLGLELVPAPEWARHQ